MEKIIIDWDGLIIMEPMGIFWNWLITLTCVTAYLRLSKLQHPPYRHWKLFFLLFGVACFFGGLGHGLYHYWGQAGKAIPWTMGIIAIYFAETGIYSFIPPQRTKLKKSLEVFSQVKLVVMLIGMTLISYDFIWAKSNSVIGLTAIVGIGGLILSRKYPELIYFTIGVLVMSSAAFIHGFDVNLHMWFNRDDLSHLIIIAGMGLFYLALRKHQPAGQPEAEPED